ncbi:hypothetical protein Ocin01_10852, partial [Orchesella cincta]
MFTTQYLVLAFTIGVISCINFSVILAQLSEESYEDGCYIAFDDEELEYNSTSLIVNQCLEKYPLNETDDPEEMENQNNCALKCINENLNATTIDGRLDIKKLKDDFKSSNATEAYASKLISLLDSCAKSTVGESEPVTPKCRIKFTDEESKLKVFQDCATKHKYEHKFWNLTIEEYQAEMDDLEAKKFDDNCFTKCWYEAIDVLDKDGKILADNFDKYFKTSNVTAPLLKELELIFKDCVKETETKFKDSKEIPCKMYGMNEFCYFNKLKGNMKKLDE